MADEVGSGWRRPYLQGHDSEVFSTDPAPLDNGIKIAAVGGVRGSWAGGVAATLDQPSGGWGTAFRLGCPDGRSKPRPAGAAYGRLCGVTSGVQTGGSRGRTLISRDVRSVAPWVERTSMPGNEPTKATTSRPASTASSSPCSVPSVDHRRKGRERGPAQTSITSESPVFTPVDGAERNGEFGRPYQRHRCRTGIGRPRYAAEGGPDYEHVVVGWSSLSAMGFTVGGRICQ